MKVHEPYVGSKDKSDVMEEDYEALEKFHRNLEDQVVNFSSYQIHVGSPPSYQQCMVLSKLPPSFSVRTQNYENFMKRPSSALIEEEEDDDFSTHSRTCQEAIALFLLLYFLMIIFCWIAVLLDGSLL